MTTFGGLNILSPEEREPDKLTMILHGLPGTGKSYAASTIAQLGKTLFIDMLGERGTESFQGTDWWKNVDVVRPSTVAELDDLHVALNKGGHGYKAVVLDSASSAAQLGMQFLLGEDETDMPQIQRGRKAAQIQHWGQLKSLVNSMSIYYANLASSDSREPVHVIFTSQTEEHEGPDGVERMYPDVSKGCRAALLAPFDFVGYTEIEADFDEQGNMFGRNVIKIGYLPNICTKRHLPPAVVGKIPDVLGKNSPVSLAALAKALGRA